MIVLAADSPSLNNDLPYLIHIDSPQPSGDNRQAF